MKKYGWAANAAITGAALIFGLPLAAVAQQNTFDGVVKIGVLTDMSGLYSDLGGQGSIEMARMAVDDFVKANKPAFKVEIVSADHQNKPDIGASKAREWFDTQGVDMITDALNSGVALAVSAVADEKKKLLIDVGAGTSALTNDKCNAHTIHYAYDTYALANVAGRAIVKQGGKTWFFLTADYAFGQALESDTSKIVKESGGTVLGSVRHPLNASDFSSFLLQAQASKAQVVGLANAGGDTINSIKAANEFGLTRTQTLAGLLVFISDIHSVGLSVAQGMLLTDGWYWDLNDETRAFGRRYFDKMKKMPSMVQAGVYSAVLQYLSAVKAAGTDDSAAVLAQMKKVKFNDVFHKNAWLRDDGRVIRDMYLMQVKKPSESKYPWDYYNVKSTVPGAEAFRPVSESRCPLLKKS